MHHALSYRQLFEATPHPYLILRADIDFTVVAVNNKYLEVTGTQREAIVDHRLFDVFSGNPNNYFHHNESDLRTSLHHVLSEKRSHVMRLQNGSENFESQYWDLVNTPVLDAEGHITYIIHHLEETAGVIVSSERARRDSEMRQIKMETGSACIKAEILPRAVEVKQERRRTDERLRESEMRFQIIFEQAATGIAIVSPEGHWLRVNHKLCQIVGYSRDELMRLTFQDITHPNDLDTDLDYVRQMLAGEITTYSMEKRYICKGSGVIWVNLTVSLVRKADDTPDYFISIVEDIQARKEIEANLKEAKRIANLGHWTWDISTNKYMWSEEIYRIYGRDLGMPPVSYQETSQYFTANSWGNLIAAMKECLVEGIAYECDAEVVRSNGEHRWIIARGEATRGADGRITALHGTVQDITERKLAEMVLQESREQLKLFIKYAPASLAMLDQKMCYLALSQRWRNDYFLGDGDLLGLCHYDIFPEIGDEWKAIHRRCLAGEVIRADEDRFERADGRVQWLRWEVHPWYLGSGMIGGIVIFSEDITHKKQIEEALQLNVDLEKRIMERTAELKALNQSLESFVYSVSHDLKAPLRGVEGYSRLLEEDYFDQLDDEGRLFISNIRAGVARMNELINDLLAYSRMERCKLESNALDLTAIVHQVLAECNEDITLHQIEIVANLPPLMAHGDREGLALVLRNLLENAIKFSKHSQYPHIEFGASQDNNHVTLWIRDNGIGFDMKYNQRIFEIFERLHRLEDYPGTGVGLALVKKAMQRMGGRVWTQSVPGEGATFYLELSAAQENPEQLWSKS